MAFLPRFAQRIFGRKKEVRQDDVYAAQRAEEAARARARRAQREAQEAAELARRLASPQQQRVQGRLAAERRVEEQRRQLVELARREREARERQRAAEAEAERQRARREDLQTKAREALLRTDDLELQRTREGSRGFYKNRKLAGTGDMPDKDAFLRGHLFSRFASSNVYSLQYDKPKQTLYIRYLKKMRLYAYFSISESEALEFYWAASKGENVWSRLRVRGIDNRTRTRKRFSRDPAEPSHLPYLLPDEASASVEARRL